MVIAEINKDLFLEEYKNSDIYVHCISMDFALGKGIAKIFKEKFPILKNKTELISEYKKQNAKYFLPIKNENIVIGNLITKKFYYEKPTYDSLTDSLVELKKYIVENNFERILMPKIGCGLDKLEWKNVKKIVEEVFEGTNIEIKVFYL